MASEIRNREGRIIATVRTSEDRRNDDAFAFGMIILIFSLAPFLPILVPAYYLYLELMANGVHQLFSILIALTPVVLAGWLLIRFPIIRLIYFETLTIGVTIFIFFLIKRNYDVIWASFWSFIVFVVGSSISYKIYEK